MSNGSVATNAHRTIRRSTPNFSFFMNIKKHEKQEGLFLVESSTGGKFYEVEPKKPYCTCPAYRFREMKKGGVCKHISAVREMIDSSNASDYEEIIAYLKEHLEVDAVELIEKFGEEKVDELKKKGEIMEQKGIIKIL